MKSRKVPEDVAAASAKLDEALSAPIAEIGVSFPSAQPKGDGPSVSPAMRRIVETVFLREAEMEAAAEKLRSSLTLGPARADYGSVIAALDEAEENTRLAHRLMITAKDERDGYERSANTIESGMRSKAEAALVAERTAQKDAGGKAKQITEADISAKICEMHDDEWEELSRGRRRLELAVRHLEHQVEVWASRCRSLQVIAGKLR